MRKCADVGLRFGLAFVGAEAMVEVAYHLGFVERKHVAFVAGPEQVGVVCHVEHAQERQAPRVLFGVVAPEDGDALVDADGDLGVAAGAEDRGGAGVRVDEQDLLGRHAEAAIWEVSHVAGAEGEGRQVHARCTSADGEQAEANRVVDSTTEQEGFVLEVKERSELGVANRSPK